MMVSLHIQGLMEEIILKMDHKIRSFPSVARNEGDNRRGDQPYPSFGPSGGWKHDRFYALQNQKDHEGSPDVVMDKLRPFRFRLRIA
uniref:Uncharacterized protein n=1 Tax=Solanum tuberosum TaxID=4113 RepID=M1E0H5_SOLTU